MGVPSASQPMNSMLMTGVPSRSCSSRACSRPMRHGVEPALGPDDLDAVALAQGPVHRPVGQIDRLEFRNPAGRQGDVAHGHRLVVDQIDTAQMHDLGTRLEVQEGGLARDGRAAVERHHARRDLVPLGHHVAEQADVRRGEVELVPGMGDEGAATRLLHDKALGRQRVHGRPDHWPGDVEEVAELHLRRQPRARRQACRGDGRGNALAHLLPQRRRGVAVEADVPRQHVGGAGIAGMLWAVRGHGPPHAAADAGIGRRSSSAM